MKINKEKLKKLINKRRITGIIFFAAALILLIISKKLLPFSVLLIILSADLIILPPLTAKLIQSIAKKTISRIIRIVNKIREKFSFNTAGSYKGLHMAGGYTDVKERVAPNSKKAAGKKRKKYKDMDNTEKIRYFYEKKINAARLRGVSIEKSMTPNESGDMLLKYRQIKKEGIELIDNYNIARYDDEGIITDDMVERVRKI